MTTQREPDTSAEELRELAVRATKYIIGPENLLEQIVATLRALADAAGQAAPAWEPTHRHYKGGEYRVVAEGRIEATMEPAIIYESRNGKVWVRPTSDFFAAVEHDGKRLRRFEALIERQAAPVPPPVEGLETTSTIDLALRGFKEWSSKPHNAKWARKIDGTPIPNDLPVVIAEQFMPLAASLSAEHDRAEGLAKEVERLKEDCAFLHRRRGQLCIQRDEEVAKHKATHAAYREAEADAEQWRERAFAAEAKLAVYEAPIGDGDQTTAEERAWFVRRADDAGRMCRDYLRLSAAHAECKGENTKLREAVSRARRELEHGWPVSAASTLDAALAPASGEKAT